ncbi:patatin-like phospholipase family protein [Flavobacterium cellulosilyticum]|uniref:Patatin n=1 Tax=Flavobacterium cellulosilyticum TaxID=2541731 RepID=A0A4R5CEJ9_9FLAO|nr:patatin-like phospholipase family protein [Flavobacterium cellulosilyticum]TDD97399.1 patatin [Flavobacterium cellulosilyticum]
MKYKVGIVLSGGGARGIAHLGILKALEEFGTKPSVISGTSAGAIAGAFYARGFSFEEILIILKKGHFFNYSNLLIKKQGFFSMKGFEKIYSNYFPTNSFSDLNIPLYVAATDVLKGEIVYFSSGDISQSLMASSCFPVIFQPVKYMETYFVDGGVLDNFPIKPLLNQCEIIIGIYVNSIKKEINEIHMNNIIDRSFHLALYNSVKNKIKKCDLFIEPPDMSQFGMFDLRKTNEIFDYGYKYGLSLEDKIKELMVNKNTI